jgi:hypothetical protein
MQQTQMTTLLALAAMAIVAAIALTYYNGSKSKLLAGMDAQQQFQELEDNVATVAPALAGADSSAPATVTGLAGPAIPGAQPIPQNPSELLPAQDQGLSNAALGIDFKTLQGEVSVKGVSPIHDVRGDIHVPNVPVGPFLNSSYDGSDHGIRYGGVCA